MYKVIGLSVSCAQRPAPLRTRCTNRLNPENNRGVRNVPVPGSIDRFIAEAQYHSLSCSAIFAATAAERARNNFNGGGIFTTSGGRNFANEMRDYPGIIVIRRSLVQRLECACANSWSDRQSGPTVIFAGGHWCWTTQHVTHLPPHPHRSGTVQCLFYSTWGGRISSPPFPFPLSSLHSLLSPLEVGPHVGQGVWGRISSRSGSGRSPAAKRICVHFRH